MFHMLGSILLIPLFLLMSIGLIAGITLSLWSMALDIIRSIQKKEF